MQYNGIIAGIHAGSIAEELGLKIGDKIVTINGQPLQDIIDLSFALADEEIELCIENDAGEQEIIAFDKDYDEELGVEFESAVFDGIRRCGNKCYFCFVDQIAPNMRPSLSVKDDDYRMSFLYGNFITLTNLRATDFDRIKRLHLSPLFISVHTTDGPLRAQILNNKRAADIILQLRKMQAADIDFHTQIVLCPGINDGDVLAKTVRDLEKLQPAALSLAIVPVGLTRYRDNCYPLRQFTKAQAIAVIDQVEQWQSENRAKHGKAFVYLGDEFYFLAERDLPAYADYDEFPQLENGIGITRDFIAQWEENCNNICNTYEQKLYLDIVCGKSAGKILQTLIDNLAIPQLIARIVVVENQFFGTDITVTGLLTGQDILAALQGIGGKRTGIIIPGMALRSGEQVFLDDLSLNDLQNALHTPIKVAHTGGQLKKLLCDWYDAAVESVDQQVYTWQTNAAYSKNTVE